MVDPAVQLRCQELVEVHLQLLTRKGHSFPPEMRADLYAHFTALLVEIATGQTILTPNKRQRAEAAKMVASG